MAGKQNFNRREFLENSAASAARVAAGIVSLGIPASGASVEALQVGVIGLGQQGLELASLLAAQPDVRVVGLCDVDEAATHRAGEALSAISAHVPALYGEHERLLERGDVDAVVIATPDHWHATLAQEACRAGKDLYIEQPLGLTLEDGEAICQTAELHKRIVQCGLPQRSGKHFQSAVELIQRGELGRVPLAKAWAVHKRRSIGSCATTAPPRGVNYRRWLGPAADRPFQANRFHQHWPWFWDYGAGELGLWGVQMLDVIRWGLQLDYPQRVFASGSRRHFRDDGETPDVLNVQYDFDDVTVLWEHRQWSRHGIEGRAAAAAFYGEKGTLIVDRSGWKVYDAPQARFAPASEIREAHMRNFIGAVHSRVQPNAPLGEGKISSAMCHLGNLAWRSGLLVEIDPRTGLVKSGGDARCMVQE